MRTPAALVPLALAIATGCTIQVTPTGGLPSPKPGTSTSPGVTTKPTPSSFGTPGPASCAALFAKLDKGGDGKLAKAEYVDGMRAIYDAQHAGETMTSCGKPDVPALLAAAFDFVDADADGTATKAEFLQDCEAEPTDQPWTAIRRPFLSPARCAQHFKAHDADGDGAWSRAEFEKGWLWPFFPFGPIKPRDVLRYGLLCSPIAAPPLDQVFQGFDADGDGKVTEGEACALFTGAKVLVTPPPTPEPTPTPVATPSAKPTPGADAPVLRATFRGGLCMYGGCSNTYTFHADGRWERADGGGGKGQGKVPPARVEGLRVALAEADMARLKARKFTGTCPTAYDGQEAVYAFPAAFGEETLASCQYELDPKDPVIAAAQALLAEAQQTE